MTESKRTTSRRLRLCVIISSFAVEGPQGGAERFAIEMVRRLDLEALEVTVCGLWDHGLAHERKWRALLHEQGIATVTTTAWTEHRWPDAIRALRFLRRYFSEHPQDIINSHSAFADIAATWGRLCGGARWLVRILHSEHEWYRHRLVGLVLNQILFPWVFAVEAGVSQKIASDLNRRPLARLLRRRARVLYNAIAWERFADRTIDVLAKRGSLGLPPDALVIGNVGRFTRQKGHRYLIEAMSRVIEHHPNCHLLLVGDGELRGRIEEQVARENLSSHVHFLGVRSDIEEILQTMDLFVSPSLWEGLPTVILEAMAARVPVICTAVSGSSELVENGHTGLIVKPGSGDALAEAILNLLGNMDRARQMADNAYAYARRFSIDEVAAEYNRLFTAYCREMK